MNRQPNISPAAFEVGIPVNAVGDTLVCWQIENKNPQLRIGLTYLELIISAATLTQVGLIRPAANAVPTAGTEVLGVSVGLIIAAGGDLSQVTNTLDAQPTYDVPAVYIRQGLVPAVIGSRLLWTWPEDNPLVIPATGSIVLRNITGGAMSAGRVSARWLLKV